MKAFAYIVGADSGAGAALKELARQIGFEAVHDFRSVPAAEGQAFTTPLVYFLFAAADAPTRYKAITGSIRTSKSQRVRFAPLIYFAENPSLETIKNCIDLGFDDVITLPFTLGRVEQRLDRQVDQMLVYFETETYFGPDRRGRLGHDEGHKDRGNGGQHKRFEIMRTPAAGVSILKEDAQIVV